MIHGVLLYSLYITYFSPGLHEDNDQVAWFPTSLVDDELGVDSKLEDFVPDWAVVDVTASLADIWEYSKALEASPFSKRKLQKISFVPKLSSRVDSSRITSATADGHGDGDFGAI